MAFTYLLNFLLFVGSAQSVPTTAAESIASDPTWGNTEGPAIDSKGTLYFCARGAFKGIVSWTKKNGAKRYLPIDLNHGPGGLWIDAEDNIYATLVGDHQVVKISPQKKVTVLAKNFEAHPDSSKGPNDIVVATDKTVYFTVPNGFDGSAPPGSIYRIAPNGKISLFNNTMVGPNGITISRDGKTIYAAGNIAPTKAKIIKFPLNRDGTSGKPSDLIQLDNCVADGMDVDTSGSIWVTCYSFGTAYRVSPEGKIQETITTAQKALTNAFFGRGADHYNLYLTSSDMDRITGYIYRAKVSVPGFR